jgi:hypothetical protein
VLQETNNPGGVGWQALLSQKPGFLSSESLNDQNLIHGYLIKTAAIISLYDSQWGDTRTTAVVYNKGETFAGKYGEIVNRIIANATGYDRNSTEFAFLRNFDVAQGHSWVDGAANGLLGTNMESSSEAINYDSALIQWGEVTGNRYVRDLGIYLHTHEVASVNLYYFNNPTPFFNIKPGTVTNVFTSAFADLPPAPISGSPAGATQSGTTVTVTTTAEHGFVAGQSVVIAGVAVQGYNGTFTILATPTRTSFTYTAAQSGLAASGGGTATLVTPVDNRPSITILHNASMGISGGFVGNIPAAQAGIQVVPLTGASLYLGSNTAFVKRNADFAFSAIAQQGETPVKPSAYLSVLGPYLAFLNGTYNGQTARAKYLADLPKIMPVNPGVPIDTASFNIHWFDVFEAYGQVDTSVTADTVSYAVFIKTAGNPATRTYVAYNPGAADLPVKFSDGFTMTVHSRTMQVSSRTNANVAAQTYPDFGQRTSTSRFYGSRQ